MVQAAERVKKFATGRFPNYARKRSTYVGRTLVPQGYVTLRIIQQIVLNIVFADGYYGG